MAVERSRLHGEPDMRTPIEVENVYYTDAIQPILYRLDKAFDSRRSQAHSPPCCVEMLVG